MKSNLLRTAVAVLLAVVAAAASAQQARRGLLNRTARGGARLGQAAAQRGAAGAEAEKPTEDPLKDVPKGTNGVPTRLAFDQAPIDILLYAYAEVANRILIQAPNLPKTQITLKTFDDRELTKDQYLNAIERELTMHGVVLEPVEDLYLYALERKTVRTQGIRTSMEISTNAIPEKGRVISQLIRLQNITAEEAQKALEGFKDPNGLFQVFERNNSILVTDTQENVNRMLELVKELDVANPVNEEVFERPIRFAVASEIKTSLELIVTESQKDAASPKQIGPKTTGAAGFQRATQTPQPATRLLGLNRPGLNKPETTPTATPNATMTAGISDADRGMIRGKVLIVSDDRSNKLIIITSKVNMNFFDKIITALDVPTTPEVKVEVVRLKYADSEDVASMLNDLIGNGSSSSGSKNNQNQAANKSAAGGATRSLTPGSTPASRPSTANPTFSKSAASTLGELNKDNIKILADKRINGIVVMARKDDMRAVKDVIEEMDVRLSQVLIETVIVQVELGDDLKTGIDWVQRGREKTSVQKTDSYGRALYYATDASGNVIGQGFAGQEITDAKGNTVTVSEEMPAVMTSIISRDGFFNNGSYALGGGGGSSSSKLGSLMQVAVDGATNVVTTANPIGGGINYLLKSDKLNIAAVLQASAGDSRTKVLASPILMTVDNKEATIEATDMIYLFSGYQYSGSAYTGGQVRNYEKRDIGLTVKVTPHINPNGTVELEVEQTFETQGADQNVPNESGGTDPYATVTTRKIQSDVSVENRQTVVMGGLTKKTNVESENGIPILKDIPWIGKWLFSSVNQSEKRSELLVFMTPYVLDEAAAAQAEAVRRKKVLSDPRPWEDNGWSLSPVADPVARKEQLRRLNEEWARQDEERKNQKALEEAKRKRARTLLQMDAKDRQEWAEAHKKELEAEQERFEEEQADYKKIIDEIREKSQEKNELPAPEPGSGAPAPAAPDSKAPAAPEPKIPAAPEPKTPAEPAKSA